MGIVMMFVKKRNHQQVDEKDCRVTILFQLAQNDPVLTLKVPSPRKALSPGHTGIVMAL